MGQLIFVVHSASGAVALNLQSAYDAGNTIITSVGVPVEIDTLTFEDDTITTSAGPLVINSTTDITIQNDANSAGSIDIRTGDANGGVIGSLQIFGGIGGGVSDGGDVVISGGGAAGLGGDLDLRSGGSNTTNAGVITIAGGVGGVVAPNGFDGGHIASAGGVGGNAVAGGTAGNGGQIILAGGDGGTGTGAAATAGNGAEVNIEAGAAGLVAGGATPGVGGDLSLSAGSGGDGTGGDVQLSSGLGDLQSGDITIFAGASGGTLGIVEVRGGNAQGIGSGVGGTVEINGGNAAVGEAQNGGSASVTGGTGDGAAGTGGTVSITGGVSTLGPGGAVTVFGGQGGTGAPDNGGFGGSATMAGGQATQTNQLGGYALVAGGNASGTGGGGGRLDLFGGNFTGTAPGTGGSTLLSSGRSSAVGATGADAGDVEVSLGALTNASATPGGFLLDSANGRITLRNYIPGSPATADTGSLRLHVLNTAGEALQSPATDGLIHFQSVQAAGIATTKGFRASKSGDYGLLARAYQRTFVPGDLAADVLTVTHNLDSQAVFVVVYSNTGAKAREITTEIISIQQTSLDVTTITFFAGYVAAGTWYVTIVGI